MKAIDVTEEHAMYFRARRGHLAGAGAPTPAEAARAVVGAQSQQLPPSLHALSMRTRGRPTAAALKAQLFAGPRTLVRTWGQRGTLFIYDAADAWARIVAAQTEWDLGPRGGPTPTDNDLERALRAIRAADGPVTRSDLFDVVPKRYVTAITEYAERAKLDPTRLAAGRLLWRLAHRGDVCVADKVGAEQSYALRTAWFPKLAWKPPPPTQAAVDLARRYLAVHGPATVQDVAHFFHAKIATVRTWLDALAADVTPVTCADRRGLMVLTADATDLRKTPPPATAAGAARWPVRLLPMFEAMLMAHADKTWTVPDAAERPRVWKKAAMVAPVVLARGRIVATWAQKVTRREVRVTVTPLSGWRTTRHLAGVRREADALAAHLERDAATVAVL